MRKSIMIISLFLFVNFVFGQTENFQEYTGILKTSEGQVIQLKLLLKEVKDGQFSGYTVTDYNGENYTKSTIDGKINISDNLFSFWEVGNTETKSQVQDSSFCFIKAPNLKIQNFGSKQLVSGLFTGEFASGKSCASGTIILTHVNRVDSVSTLKNENNQDKREEKAYVKQDDSVLSANDEIKARISGNTVFLKLWDGNKQDKDMVAVYVNDIVVKEKVILRNKKIIIELLDIKAGDKLKIVALNEGFAGRNTLNFQISGNKEYVSKMSKGECFRVVFQ